MMIFFLTKVLVFWFEVKEGIFLGNQFFDDDKFYLTKVLVFFV